MVSSKTVQKKVCMHVERDVWGLEVYAVQSTNKAVMYNSHFVGDSSMRRWYGWCCFWELNEP
jgi:hypothetical protein